MPNETATDSIPVYYRDQQGSLGVYRPFVVAPYRAFQDTIIVGHQSLGWSHDQFISALYRTSVAGLEALALRAFLYHSNVCFAATMPTQLCDEAGRKGLFLSIGFTVEEQSVSCGPAILAKYLILMLETFNRYFSLDLPSHGADEFVRLIQEDSTVSAKLQDSLGAVLLASEAVAKASAVRRGLSRFRKCRARHKIPRAILYHPSLNYTDIVDLFFETLWPILSRQGHMGVQQDVDTSDSRGGLLSLLPLPRILADAGDVEYR